jgi:hypothetical protein
MKRNRKPTKQEIAYRQHVIRRMQRRAAFNDAFSSLIVFVLILVAAGVALSLGGCVVTNPSSVDPSFQGMAAQATATAARYNVQLTQAAATSIANVAAQQTAVSVNATTASIQATATISAQETAVVEATATEYGRSQEAIALEAMGTREKLATEATATAIALATQYGIDKANRAYWFWIGLLFIVVTALAGIAYAVIKILLRNAATVRDNDGTIVFFRGVSTLDGVPDVPQLRASEHMTANIGSNSRGIPRERQGKTLYDAAARPVYEFTGRQLDKMVINIMNYDDMGFRRNTSNAGRGLDGLCDIKNNELYSRIELAMKHAGYIREDRGRSFWTDKGMVDFLGMSTRPNVHPPPLA